MTQDASTVRIAGNGRLSLPTKFRRQIGLENGGVVVVRVEDGEIRIRPVKAIIEEIQNLAAPYLAGSGETVDQFLADRRADALSDD
jgi:AbrB family looped-hinge helix DNA binding protein